MRLIALMIYHPWCKFDMKLTFCNTIMFIVSVVAAFYFVGKKKGNKRWYSVAIIEAAWITQLI